MRGQRFAPAPVATEAPTHIDLRLKDILKVSDIDRVTLWRWAKDFGFTVARGVVRIEGATALEFCRSVLRIDDGLLTEETALDFLSNQFAERGENPEAFARRAWEPSDETERREPTPFFWSSSAFSDWGTYVRHRIEKAPVHGGMGIDGPVRQTMNSFEPREMSPLRPGKGTITVDELADLLMFEPKTGKARHLPSSKVRRLLKKHGIDVTQRESIPTTWLKTQAGKKFWAEAWEMLQRRPNPLEGDRSGERAPSGAASESPIEPSDDAPLDDPDFFKQPKPSR